MYHNTCFKTQILRTSRTDAVHERTARVTEVVSHGGVWPDRCDSIFPALEVVAATNVLQIFIVDAEVGRKHRRCQFAAIDAVANESVD